METQINTKAEIKESLDEYFKRLRKKQAVSDLRLDNIMIDWSVEKDQEKKWFTNTEVAKKFQSDMWDMWVKISKYKRKSIGILKK